MAVDYARLEQLERDKNAVIAELLALRDPVAEADIERLAAKFKAIDDEKNAVLYPPVVCPDPSTLITILDVAKAWGAKAEPDGSINGGEFDRLDLPIICGCEHCHATLGAYNAYPSKSGFTRCKECIGPDGYPSVAEFEADGNPRPKSEDTNG